MYSTMKGVPIGAYEKVNMVYWRKGGKMLPPFRKIAFWWITDPVNPTNRILADH